MARTTSKGTGGSGPITGKQLPRHVHQDVDILGIDAGATNNRIYSQSSTPAGGTNGDLWWDTTNRQMYTHDGTNWNTVMSPSGVRDNADVTTPLQIGCKLNQTDFTTSNPGEIYFHGYDSDGNAADVSPKVSVNGVTTTLNKGFTNPNIACDVAYIVYDTGWALSQDYVLMRKVAGAWTYYDNSVQASYSPTGSEIVIGVADQSAGETVASAVVWGYGMRMEEVPDIGADQTGATIESGVTLAAGYLRDTGNNIDIDFANQQIQIGSSASTKTFGNAGVQLGKYSGAYKFYAGDGASQFMQWDGTGLTVSGTLTFASGSSGYSNISDKPTSLSGINGTEGTKLSGIEDGANATDLGTVTVDGNNLVFNGGGYAKALDGRPAGWLAAYSTTDPSIVSYLNESLGHVKIYSASDSAIGCVLPAFRVEANTKYKVRFKYKTNVAAASGFYCRVPYLTSELPDGATHLSSTDSAREDTTKIALGTSYTTVLNNVATTTSWQTYEFTYTPPASTVWAGIYFLNWTGIGTNELHLTDVSVTPIIDSDADKTSLNTAAAIAGQGAFATQSSADWSTQVSGSGKPADNADVTQSALQAGTTMGAGYLHLNGGTANIAIGASTTWQSTGIQLQYNSGTPRWFTGNYSAGNYIEFDGTDINVGYDTNIQGVIGWNQNHILKYSTFVDGYVTTYNTVNVTWFEPANIGSVGGAARFVRPTSSSSAGSGTLSVYSPTISVLPSTGWDIPDTRFRGRIAFRTTFSGNGNNTDYVNVVFGVTGNGVTTSSGHDCIGVQCYRGTSGSAFARRIVQRGSTNYLGTSYAISDATYLILELDNHTPNSSFTMNVYTVNTTTKARTLLFTETYSSTMPLSEGQYLITTTLDVNSTNLSNSARNLYLFDYLIQEY